MIPNDTQFASEPCAFAAYAIIPILLEFLRLALVHTMMELVYASLLP